MQFQNKFLAVLLALFFLSGCTQPTPDYTSMPVLTANQLWEQRDQSLGKPIKVQAKLVGDCATENGQESCYYYLVMGSQNPPEDPIFVYPSQKFEFGKTYELQGGLVYDQNSSTYFIYPQQAILLDQNN